MLARISSAVLTHATGFRPHLPREVGWRDHDRDLQGPGAADSTRLVGARPSLWMALQPRFRYTLAHGIPGAVGLRSCDPYSCVTCWPFVVCSCSAARRWTIVDGQRVRHRHHESFKPLHECVDAGFSNFGSADGDNWGVDRPRARRDLFLGRRWGY